MIRAFYICAGTIGVGLGIAGIVLPLVPATPFLLFAAWCYTQGSPRMKRWLLEHPVLGPPVLDFRERRPLPRGRMISILTLLWLSILVSASVVDPVPLKVLLICIAAGVTSYLLIRQGRLRSESSSDGSNR